MIIIHSLRVAACLKVGGPLIDRKLRSKYLETSALLSKLFLGPASIDG